SVLIDDVPYGSSSTYGGAGAAPPDLDPSELARVEVLRGPQGTLYGSSGIGGLLKFVTLDPSTSGFSGPLQVGTSASAHSSETGYNVRGSANIPLSDTWAVRASAFSRRDPGYVDDPVHGFKDLNTVDVTGGRIAAMYKPSDTFSVKLSALAQKLEGD